MTTPLYYTYPFGQNADDLTSIPMSPAGDGSVSYYYGWTDPYEYDLLTNPSALPIPRGQMNQLFFDITNNLQEYQQYGSPQWVTGNTVAYPQYARVYFGGKVYENQVAANTVTPGTDASWVVISASANAILPGVVIDWAGPVAPSGYLLTDGSAVSRTTYANLLAAITQTQSGGTFSATSAIVSGLTNCTTTMYPGMAIECANFTAGTVISSITNSTTIVLSNNSSSSVSAPITFFSWGNGNGTTTFNVPNLRNRVTSGEGGTLLNNPSAQVDVVGQTTGASTYTMQFSDLAAHAHDLPAFTGGNNNGGGPAGSTDVGTTNTQQFTNGIHSAVSQTAMPIVQPTAIMYKIIKT